ncbi:MAG: hypothetical protein V2I56_08460 [Desulfobacteraceae bacterium]|jgi:hypothetical protein|nr:hypothetical protein [Desulfobacteraceae bacterium]
MTREFDPKKSYLAVKANEKMIAYAGFNIDLEGYPDKKEGVVKISSFQRAYGGGYLTLTFIVDKGQDETLIEHLERLCAHLTEDALKPLLGKDFERMVKVDLDLLEETKGWYVEEINVYFRSIAGQEKTLVESIMIPALEKTLPCKFDAVEWWPEGKEPGTPRPKDVEGNISLGGLFRKWFGSN